MSKINVSNKPVKFVTTENEKVPQLLSATGSLIVTEQQYTNSAKANFLPTEAYGYIGIFLGGEHVASGYGQPTADIRDTLTYVAYYYASDIDGLASYLYSSYAYTIDYIDNTYDSLFNDITELNTYITDSYAYTIDYINNVYSYTINYVDTLNNKIWSYTENAYAYTLGYIATSYASMYSYTTGHGNDITYLIENKEYTNFSNTYTISELFEASLIKPEYVTPVVSSYAFNKKIFDLSTYNVPQTFTFSMTVDNLDVLENNTTPCQSKGILNHEGQALTFVTVFSYALYNENTRRHDTGNVKYSDMIKNNNTCSYTFSIKYNSVPELSNSIIMSMNHITLSYDEANDGYYEPLSSNGINIVYTGNIFNKTSYIYNIETSVVGQYPIVYLYGDNLNNLTVKRTTSYYNITGDTNVNIPFDENMEVTYFAIGYPENIYTAQKFQDTSYFKSVDAFGESMLDNGLNIIAENIPQTYNSVNYTILYVYQNNNRKLSGIKTYKAKISKQ